MFANVLNEEEKKNFLELIYRTALINNKYPEEQQQLLNSYKAELGLDEVPDTSSFGELLAYFSEKSTELKKIVYFELYGMIIADYNIDEKESEALDMIKEKFNLDDELYSEIEKLVSELQSLYDKIYDVLF